MELFYREYGAGEPLIILHGLFGSSDNWMTQAKMLAERFQVFTVDQRNHGQSPHSADHDYLSMTEDLQAFFVQHKLPNATLIGHSMGGKTAMNFAVKYPLKVKKLVVVDIVPKAYPLHHDKILDGLRSLPIKSLTSRNQADTALAPFVEEPEVRQFLLKNLAREQGGGFVWKMNLSAIHQNIEEMGIAMVFDGQYAGPSLFIIGERSNYFRFGDEAVIQKYFPNFAVVGMETGHWVQAEKPKEFVDVVLKFLLAR
jgi:esterase